MIFFGEVLYPTNTNNELFVEAKENCEILSFIYDHISSGCNPKCKFHKEFEQKLPILIMNNAIKLNTRIELLTKKSIRDKLLTYFNILSSRTFSKTFSIPFTLTDLADYLSVDRSAMMRELSHLKEEGFIKKNGNKITLLLS
jgi:CRP-like cAMP-binding protein